MMFLKLNEAERTKRAQMKFAEKACPNQPARADLGLHCPLTESMDTAHHENTPI